MDENRIEGTARQYGGRVQEGVGRSAPRSSEDLLTS
jgi:uncharacterized protein YjbJ (UPF0337 family)